MIERAKEQVLLRALGVVDSITGDDGEFWSASNLSGGDFIAYYNDLVEHIAPVNGAPILDENGEQVVDELGIPAFEQIPMPHRVLDHLRVISPKFAEQLDRQYEREIARMVEAS